MFWSAVFGKSSHHNYDIMSGDAITLMYVFIGRLDVLYSGYNQTYKLPVSLVLVLGSHAEL